MARDWIDIGPTPPGEGCVPMDTHDYTALASRECRVYIDQLRRHLGPEPEGASLRVRWFPHDFGMYAEVVCYYDTDNGAALEYAMRCEDGGPEHWDDVARAALLAQPGAHASPP